MFYIFGIVFLLIICVHVIGRFIPVYFKNKQKKAYEKAKRLGIKIDAKVSAVKTSQIRKETYTVNTVYYPIYSDCDGNILFTSEIPYTHTFAIGKPVTLYFYKNKYYEP